MTLYLTLVIHYVFTVFGFVNLWDNYDTVNFYI